MKYNTMDTYRVQLPHPQPIENEESFVTNSGRKIKRPTVGEEQQKLEGELKLGVGEDINSSGVSVLSPDSFDKEVNQNGELSDSVQAELHLSLERLSENYDPEELKRLQERSRNSNVVSRLSEQRRLNSETSPGIPGTPVKFEEAPLVIDDSLDAEVMEHTTIPAEELDVETSEEFRVSGDDDDRTIVADSLNYPSFGDGVNAMSSAHSSRKSNASIKTPFDEGRTVKEHDQYADLRYNPNFARQQANKLKAMKDSNEEHSQKIPEIDDSLEETEPQKTAGGAIVIHRKGLLSPATPKWENEGSLKFSMRSISPTRLSADPVKLLQTNALYEEEFNKMLKAEILNNTDQPAMNDRGNLREHRRTSQDTETPRTESYSVLIRKIEQQDKRYTSDEPIRIGGYQLLPDRHRIPSPSRGMNVPEMPVKRQQRTPKKLTSPRSQQSPDEYFYTGKKDPLVALSPREKKKVTIAPTPPRFPKPQDIDYIELNKQRLSRKTNSAGYLDLHRKRSRQVEVLENRSQSEIKRSAVQQSPRHEMQLGGNEYPPGSVEDLWARQVERLKGVRGQNLNHGKAKQPRPKPPGFVHGDVMDASHFGGHSQRDRIEEERAWEPYFHQLASDGVNSQESSANTRVRQPLPIPSQTVAKFSPRHFNGSSPRKGYPEANNQDIYFSPRMRPIDDQNSPLLQAYQARFATDVYQPKVINGGNILQQSNGRNIPNQYQREPDVWMNPNTEHDFPPNDYMSHLNTRFNRKVTFVGDNEPIAIEGVNDEFSSSIGSGFGLNRYKVPLPPTPPSKSQRHAVQRMRFHPEGKENDAGYYDVREDTYPVLPPILKPSKAIPYQTSPREDNESKHTEDNGSYFEQYEKEKSRKKIQYRIYTLNDYKNLKKDVKLGGLGPDLASAREKMEKIERAKQYAELIRKEHMTSGVIKQKENVYETNGTAAPGFDEKHHFSATMDENQRRNMLEKRTRAIEYSKRVPKPKTKPIMDLPSRTPGINSHPSNYSPDIATVESSPEGNDFNYGLLEMMKERHEKEKAQVAAFTGNG